MSGKNGSFRDLVEIAKFTIVLASTTGKVSLCYKNLIMQDPAKLMIYMSFVEELKDIGNFEGDQEREKWDKQQVMYYNVVWCSEVYCTQFI